MLIISSKVLRSSQGVSVLRNRAIREFHASRAQSVEWSSLANERRPIRQGTREANATQHSSTARKEIALPSQEGHTGLVSHVLYAFRSASRSGWICGSQKDGTQDDSRPDCKLVARKLPVAHDLRPRLLRHRNDASIRPTIRPGQVGNILPSLAAPIRRLDRRGYGDQQDGARTEADIRPDA